jgi:spore maturation protein CgeB
MRIVQAQLAADTAANVVRADDFRIDTRDVNSGHRLRTDARNRCSNINSVANGSGACSQTRVKIVIFGLTLSSSWGNGHATLWRGLITALGARGHEVVFFEKDVPYYAAHRDFAAFPGAELVLYGDWTAISSLALRHVASADATIVTSYCPDANTAAHLCFDVAPAAIHVFYDLDTPVTLARMNAGERVDYLPAAGLRGFDLVLSYTGGAALTAMKDLLGARRVAPLYGHVDPLAHRPVPCEPGMPRADLSYLGTYAPDRQAKLEQLLVGPARQRPARRFVLGGSGYPDHFPWTENLFFIRHVPPARHPAFFCSSRLTLNVTRGDMATLGYCPSGRLFEAAACGTALLSDCWEGLEQFLRPGEEILLANSTEEALRALDLSDVELARIARAGRERVLSEHTSAHRAEELVSLLEDQTCGESFPPPETAAAFSPSPSPRNSCP